MRPFAAVASAMAAVGLLASCATPFLSSEDRKQVCSVEVHEKFGPPIVVANVLSNAAGGLVGAGGGALVGLTAGYLAILGVPLGALIGAGHGAACAVASQMHPTAETDFERLLRTADASVLKRALEADVNAPRAECSTARAEGPSNAAADTVIDIEKVEAGMGCLYGQQEYWISVQWRAISVKTGRVLKSATTRCTQLTLRSIEDWFASRDQARAEIDRALARTGQRMAMELLALDSLAQCQFEAHESGELEAR
jgi:hypothetical protein